MVGNPGQIAPTNMVTLNGGATLNLCGSNTLAGLVFNSNGDATTPTVTSYDTITAGSGFSGATFGNKTGTLTLTGDIVVSPTNVAVTPLLDSGNLNLNGTNTHNIMVEALSEGNFVNNQTLLNGLTISSAIQNGGFTKKGGGVLNLTNSASSYNGQLTVEEGVLLISSINNINANGVLGNSANPVILGASGGKFGSLEFTGFFQTSSKPFTLAAGGGGIFQIDSSFASGLTLSGVISGSGNLTKTGVGTLILANTSNTYTGNTTVSGGVLSISSAFLADTSTVTIAAGATLNLNTASAVDTIASLVLGGVSVPAGTCNASHPTYGSYFTGTGSLMVIAGPTLAATTTTLTLSGGANPSNLGDALTFTATVTGSTPTGNVTFYAGATVIGTGALSGSYQASVITSSLVVGSYNITAQYSGNGSNAASTSTPLVQVVQASASSAKDILTFVFPGLPATTISGTDISVTVPYGTNVTTLAPTYTVSPLASGSPASGTTRDFTSQKTYTITAQDSSIKVYTVTVNQPATIITHPASVAINSGSTATLNVIASGTAPLTYQWYQGASGTTTTPVGTNSASFTTPTLITTTSYWVKVTNAANPSGSNSSTATVTVNPVATLFTWTGAVSGNWSDATKWTNNQSSGTAPIGTGQVNYSLNFNATGTYTATNNLNTGFLLNQLNFGGSAVTLAGNSLALSANGATLPRISQNGSAWVNIAAPFVLDSNLTADGAGTGSVVIAGAVSGTGGLTKASTGPLWLTGLNTYTGITTINTGTLQASIPAALPGRTTAGKITVADGATLSVNAGGSGEFTTAEIGTLVSNATFLSNTSVLGIDTTNALGGTFTATNISKALSLSKLGTGTLVLGIGNTYNGNTTITAGTLALGASDVLPNKSAVSIGSATLDAATFNDTAGTLKATGDATIHLGSGDMLAFADSSVISWTGATLTITGNFVPGASLRFGTNSSGLTAAQLALISAAGFGSFTLDANGYLTANVSDITPPIISSLSPADNATGVAAGANLVLTFNETIAPGTGSITIRNLTDSTQSTIAVTDAMHVSLSGAVLTINSTADLVPGKSYAIRIDTGAVMDQVGNVFAGIADDTTWNFATAAPATTPPTITSPAPPAIGTVGGAYNHTCTASGTTPITFSVTSGALPSGLAMTGVGVISGTPSAAGTFSGTITATNGTLPNATQNFSIAISPAATTTTLASSLGATGVYGNVVAFTATVSGVSATGTVTFKDDATVLGTGSLNGSGQAVYSTNTLAAGGHSITANYGGDFSFAPSASAVISYTVSALPVAITGVTAADKVYDRTTAATLSGGTVSGTVNSESVTVVAGSGAFASANVGNQAVTVSGYGLGGANAGNYVLASQPVVANATITARPLQLTGSRAYDGTTTAVAGILTLSNNLDGSDLILTGSANLAGKDVGTQPLVAASAVARVQSATGSTGGGLLANFNVTLTTPPVSGNTLVAVISTRGTSAGRVIGITQTGANWSRASEAANPNGTTTEIWYATNVSSADSSLIINQAALRSAAVVMEYSGIAATNPLDQIANTTGYNVSPVTGTTPATTLPSELWIGGIGYASSVPTLGSLLNSFTSFASSQSTSSTTAANAKVYSLERITTATAAASSGGTLSAAAQWSGALATFKASTSSALTLSGPAAANYTLTGAAGSVQVTATGLTITANNQSKNYGQSVVFGLGSTQFSSVGLENGETIGSVTLSCDGGDSAVVAGSPYIITPSAPTGGTFTPGNYMISYVPGTLTVNAATTTTTVASSPNPSIYGGPVTITATVTGSTPTGNVSFRDGATLIGTQALNGSFQAGITTSELTIGDHLVTARYEGDGNNSASDSASSAVQTVMPSLSSAKDILTFDFGLLGPATITGTTISLTVPYGTNVTSLAPTYTVSAGAVCDPASGAAYDFTAPVHYIVTAEDGLSINDYTVTVNQPAAIVTHPASVTINRGGSTTLSVAASGTAPLTYQWYQGASGTTTTLVGTNSASFTTPTLTTTTSYWVKVTNAANPTGARSNTATVTVMPLPIVSAWGAAASLVTARDAHTMTLLPTGKVLVAGGRNTMGTALTTAEVYDPESDTWAATAALPAARFWHASIVLLNGKVLVAGGFDGFASLASAALYDPASGTWTLTGSMTQGRDSFTATLLVNDKVLVSGGYTNSGITGGAELYDPATGTWTGTGSLNTASAYHSATLLASGKVLVAGGQKDSGIGTARTEIYDPANGSWSLSGALAAPCVYHSATLLPNGTVLLVGGKSSTATSLASAQVFDPVAATWTATAAPSSGRFSHSANLLPNGQLLVIGGFNTTSGMLASAEQYDYFAGTWTTLGALGTARLDHTATLLPSGKLLISGGWNKDSSTSLASSEVLESATAFIMAGGSLAAPRAKHAATLLATGKVLLAGGLTGAALASVDIYDPATGTTMAGSPMAAARYLHSLNQLQNGKVLVAGGNSGAATLGSAEIFDSAVGTWTSTGTMVAARELHTATLLQDGKVLVAGGKSGITPLATAELYNPFSGAWTSTGDLGATRYSHTATLLANGKVLVVGGKSGATPLASVQLYDPASATWMVVASMNTARYEHTATLLPNGKVLVAGGSANTTNLSSAELYDPSTDTWTVTHSMAGARGSHTATLLPGGKVLISGGGNGNVPLASTELYDPASGGWISGGTLGSARKFHTATVLTDGHVLISGGYNSTYLSSAELYNVGLKYQSAWQPQINTPASALMLGTSVSLTGSQFRGISGASSGTTQDSPGNLPIAQLYGVESGRMMFLTTTGWTDTSYNSAAVVGMPVGTAILTMTVNGIPASVLTQVVKATATVTLGDLVATYDGTVKHASATTTPDGLAIGLTYDGLPSAPTHAGKYAVVATIEDADHSGTASGDLIISKATATVTLGDLATTYDGTAKHASASTTPDGLPIGLTYDGLPSAPTHAGKYAVIATIEDADHSGTASGDLVIGKASQVITFAALADQHLDTLTFGLEASSNSGLAVQFSVVSGPVSVSGSQITLNGLGEVVLCASQTGDTNWLAAVPVLVNFHVVAGNYAQDYVWAKGYGGSGYDTAYAVATNASGQAYLLGDFENTVTFGASNYTSTGSSDLVLMKMNGDGSIVWSRQYGGVNADYAKTVVTLPSGGVVAGGEFYTSTTISGTTLTSAGSKDIVLIKVDTDGTTQWVKRFGGTSSDSLHSMATDAVGNLYLAGQFNGSIIFGTVTLTSGGDSDGFVAKLDANGTPLWARKMGGAGNDIAYAVAVNASGEIAVAGAFSGSATCGRIPLADAGGSDAFVTLLDASGGYVWAKRFGGSSADSARAAAFDSVGNLWVCGSFSGSSATGFGTSSMASAGAEDIFVLRLASADGTLAEAIRYGGSGSDAALALVADPYGAMMLAGSFQGTVDFGSSTLISAGGTDTFVAKLRPGAGVVWAIRGGGTNDDRSQALAVNPSGEIFHAGVFDTNATFGNHDITCGGLWDLFVAKINGPLPSFTAGFAEISVNEGDPWSLATGTLGVVPVTFQWFKNGVMLTGATSSNYGVAAASLADAGVYVLKATNAYGSSTTQPVSVTVTDRLPDQVLTIEPPSATSENRRIEAPVYLDSLGDIGSVTFVIPYNKKYLIDPVFTPGTGLVADGLTVMIDQNAGTVRVAASAQHWTFPGGRELLGTLSLTTRSVPADTSVTLTPILLNISDEFGRSIGGYTKLEGGTMGIAQRGIAGDANNNGRLDVADAAEMRRLCSNPAQSRSWDQTLNDLTGDNSLSEADAAAVLDAVAGLDSTATTPGNPLPGALARLVLTRLTGSDANKVLAQIYLDGVVAGQAGLSFRVGYPASVLRIVGASSLSIPAGGLPVGTTPQWNVVPANNYAQQTGSVAFAAAWDASHIFVSGQAVANIVFEIYPTNICQVHFPLQLTATEVAPFSPNGPSSPLAVAGGNVTFSRSYTDWALATLGDANADANGDADHDGQTNGFEFAASTDPADASSSLQTTFADLTSSGFTLRWLAASGVSYRVRWSADLVNWSDLTEAPYVGAGVEVEITDPAPRTGNRFYRVEVIPE